jgi:hypothetical protein
LPKDSTITISVIGGPAKGLAHQLTTPRFSIGRAGGATDIEINDLRVSVLHCAVAVSQDRIRLYDLDSTSGTYVDEERIETAELGHSAEFRVGSSLLLVTILPKRDGHSMNLQCALTVLPTLRHASCTTSGCSGPSVDTLGKQDYWREHFIQTCYEHIEECSEKFRERDQADELGCDTRRRSLQEIVDQATAASLTHGDLSNLERIQLLDIVRWAGDLIRQIRRSRRRRVTIPVRLHLESSSQTCAEETLAREVSQHGTALTCRFPIVVGELVKIERIDTSERVEGIVRWCERRDGTTLHLGIEFYGCNNFWRLHW